MEKGNKDYLLNRWLSDDGIEARSYGNERRLVLEAIETFC
jgi:hypothetical protein